MAAQTTTSRIESELEVRSYLQDLKYALDHGARLTFQEEREVDRKTLTVEEYLRTVKDLRFAKRSEMREFGKVYNSTDEVYIKIRVELLGLDGNHTTFVMSFHYAQTPFSQETFPYRQK